MKITITKNGVLNITRRGIEKDAICIYRENGLCHDGCPHFSEPEQMFYDISDSSGRKTAISVKLELCNGKVWEVDIKHFIDERGKKE
jgi:hypothetical protein